MKPWQLTLRELLLFVLICAISVYGFTIGEAMTALGFLPGAYLAGTFVRHYVHRTAGDLFRRVVVCALGGAFSQFAMVLVVLIAQKITPLWLSVLLLLVYSAIGLGLGAVYGAAETVLRWPPAGDPRSPNCRQ